LGCHTRIAVVADINGNLPALESVLADIKRRHDIDRIINLGDFVSGPLWPREVCDLLMARTWSATRQESVGICKVLKLPVRATRKMTVE
jgi:Calcineurin-like phosphoesterase